MAWYYVFISAYNIAFTKKASVFQKVVTVMNTPY